MDELDLLKLAQGSPALVLLILWAEVRALPTLRELLRLTRETHAAVTAPAKAQAPP